MDYVTLNVQMSALPLTFFIKMLLRMELSFTNWVVGGGFQIWLFKIYFIFFPNVQSLLAFKYSLTSGVFSVKRVHDKTRSC